MTAETFSPGTKGIITNLVAKTYSAGANEVHCYATPINNLGKCRLTDKFFRAFGTLIL